MPSNAPPLVVYVGDDAQFAAQLACLLAAHDCELSIQSLTSDVETWTAGGDAVLVFDGNLSDRAALVQLRAQRHYNAGVPLIVVSDSLNLTNVGLARLNGADAVLFKPIDDERRLLAAIEAGFRRIDRWRQAADKCHELAAASARGCDAP